jgi:hypothetical protein
VFLRESSCRGPERSYGRSTIASQQLVNAGFYNCRIVAPRRDYPPGLEHRLYFAIEPGKIKPVKRLGHNNEIN